MNSFGTHLRFTSFGESHGKGLGVVIDNLPAGLEINEDFLNAELKSRRPAGKLSTPRREKDPIELLSGVFSGKSTGAPLAIFVRNDDTRSKDYDAFMLRPSHADYAARLKYDNVDYRGGGRFSARESVARCLAGAVAKLLLKEFGISVEGALFAIGGVGFDPKDCDFAFAKTQESRCGHEDFTQSFEGEILDAKQRGDSVGASALIRAKGLIPGLGEPLYDKLDAKIAAAFMGLNAVKAVEIGLGSKLARMRGSQANDAFSQSGLSSNKSGGITAGMSTGEDILALAHFKPTPSIALEQELGLWENGAFAGSYKGAIKGRHDPCVGVRGVVVLESMLAFVLADAILQAATSRLDKIKTVFSKEI